MNVVELTGVSKKYALYAHPGGRFLELATFRRLRFHREHWALQDISFSIEQGETFCIVGENGSGKSTLLQIIAGILAPTSGTVEIKCRVAALLELGAGFHPEFSGRDNLFLNASIQGLSARELEARLPEILEFAEIGSAIDQPVKTYSSGMVIRLAFALAVHVDAEILLVDEALAVGDIYFRQRCLRKIHELRAKGVTIVFVSHEIGDVKALGHRTLWLENGRIVELGDTREVSLRYMEALTQKDSAYRRREQASEDEHHRAPRERPREIVTTLPDWLSRYGNGRAEIIGIAVVDESGQPIAALSGAGSLVVRVSVRAHQPIASPMVGIQIRNEQGVDFAGTNTSREGVVLPPLAAEDLCTVDFHLEMPELSTSTISFSPAIADGTLAQFQVCDMIQDAVQIEVQAGGRPVYGYMHIPCNWVTFTRATEQALA